MTSPQHTLALIDAAITRFDQALDALGQIPKTGELSVTVDGIDHELRGLVERLRSLRDDVAGEDA
jgi:hypothetical protein